MAAVLLRAATRPPALLRSTLASPSPLASSSSRSASTAATPFSGAATQAPAADDDDQRGAVAAVDEENDLRCRIFRLRLAKRSATAARSEPARAAPPPYWSSAGSPATSATPAARSTRSSVILLQSDAICAAGGIFDFARDFYIVDLSACGCQNGALAEEEGRCPTTVFSTRPADIYWSIVNHLPCNVPSTLRPLINMGSSRASTMAATTARRRAVEKGGE